MFYKFNYIPGTHLKVNCCNSFYFFIYTPFHCPNFCKSNTDFSKFSKKIILLSTKNFIFSTSDSI